VLALKPVETGVPAQDSKKESTDARRLERASTAPAPPVHPLFAFAKPVSPHLAARTEGRLISIPRIRNWVRASDQNSNALRDTTLRWTLVETAGGAFSPLTAKATNADLARALDPAIWILVAPDSLGVLHDLRATMLALQHHARSPDFVVLSRARVPDASTGTNARELSRLGIARPIATLPRGSRPERALERLVSELRSRVSTFR
jgi:dethiobiotin synthase